MITGYTDFVSISGEKAMTDTPIHQPDVNKDRRVIMLIYALQFVGLVSAGVASLIGVIIAHVKSGDVEPTYQSHLDYQMRTFWYGLAIAIVGFILTIVFIGWLVLFGWWLWTLIRTIKGFLAANDSRPIEAPQTMLW